MNRTAAYVLIWWNAYGQPQQSAPMDKATAAAALAAMHPTQDARLSLVYINA